MEILWITPRRFGADMCQTTQIGAGKAISRLNHSVTFLSPQSKEFEPIAGLKFLELEYSPRFSIQTLGMERAIRKNLRGILDSLSVDICIVEWQLANSSSKILIEKSIPWVILDRSPPIPTGIKGRIQALHYRKSWKLASRSDGACVKSDHLLNHLSGRYELPERTAVMPSGVDLEIFEEPQPKPTQLKVAYHGRLDKLRDIDAIVQACEIINSTGGGVSLLLFGEGDLYRNLTRKADATPWMEVMGRVPPDSVPGILDSCHIGVIPLPDLEIWHHASPLKLFEFAASGLCVIATDIPCHRSIGERSWMTLYDPRKRIDGIVQSINQLSRSGKISELSKTAREDSENEFTWDDSIRGLNTMLNSILGSAK